jgi:signal transduction histidine kinase
MSDQATVIFMLTFLFFVISLVFILFVVFLSRKMIQHRKKIAAMELAKVKQDLRDSLEIQEKDLEKLGADLHDELGPTLSAVKLKINSLSSNSPIPPADLQQLRSMLDHTIYNVRTLSHALYPNALKEFGMVNAVQDLIKRLSTLTDVQFSTEIDPEANKLDYNIQLSLYRIIQEFFNNSLKHSGCSQINLHLDINDQAVTLELSDNGKGFEMTGGQKEGLGLKNMRMRAESIDATFQWLSEKEKGAILQVRRQLYGQNASSHPG